MHFFKGLLSFFITNLAIAVITVSALAWMVDATVLEPKKLLPALRESGTAATIAKAIPEIIDSSSTPDEAAPIKEKVASIATEAYIDQKLSAVVTTFTSYIKTGHPAPSIDLSDLPGKITASGVQVPAELQDTLAKPITLQNKNTEDAFGNVKKSYELMQTVKIIGPILALILLAVDWLLADRGRKTTRFAHIFLSLTIWSGGFWLAMTQIPNLLASAISKKAGDQGQALAEVGISIIKGVGGLFSRYLLIFTIACASMTVLLYILHLVLERKTTPKTPTTPVAKTSAKTPAPKSSKVTTIAKK